MPLHSRSRVVSTALFLGALVCDSGFAQAAPPAEKDGAEVQARGPVHEAYAEPVTPRPQEPLVVPKQPPEPIEELPPEQKPEGDNVRWIPGYWAWDDDRKDFLWISGFWRATPPGRQWVPGHWQKAEKGWQRVPGFWAKAGQQEVEVLPVPPASLDRGPEAPAPAPQSTYVPGCWVFHEARYRWRPGFWVAARPGWAFVPAHYLWTPAGCVYVDGYWDHALSKRGLLFAPVHFGRPPARGGGPFIPRYAVNVESLVGALFVRPAYCHYYFGDYFGERYEQRGFVAWVDYRVGRQVPDPLFDSFRLHQGGGRWEQELRRLYTARRQSEAPALPHTLVEQEQLIEKFTASREEYRRDRIEGVTVLLPLAQLNKKLKLHKLPKEVRVEEQQAALLVREVARQRLEAEAVLLAEGRSGKDNGKAHKLKLKLPGPPKGKKGWEAAPTLPPYPELDLRAFPGEEFPDKPHGKDKGKKDKPKKPKK